jgi:UDP-N-acetylmuramoylalanine--D-glutamate ligase
MLGFIFVQSAESWRSEVNWHDKKILVLGAGDTGLSAVRYLGRMGARVRVADSRNDPPGIERLRNTGTDVVTGPFTASLFSDAELIVASPGVAVAGPACDAALTRAIAQGKKVVGDIELFAWQQNEIANNTTREVKNENGRHSKVIGITGSNGKSTVTAMAGAMCAAAGLKTVMAGNIGLPVLDALAEADEHGAPDVYVLELSSFQLETTSTLQLESAAMLNLSQDHLDRYASMNDYGAAKARIFTHAKHQVLNRDDAQSMAMRNANLACSTFGLNEPLGSSDLGVRAHEIVAGLDAVMPLNEMPVAGLHNAANAMAAFALCRTLGVDSQKLVDGLRNFKGLPHRLENVGTINGVTFYDDSKGTNVGSTVAALNGMTVPVVLIAGGEGKQQDFLPLAEPIRKRAKAVVLIGKDARLINSAITSARVQSEYAKSMADAVELAYRRASSGDAVLLSPACASFDMFKNYKHRGEVFAQCVAELKAKAGHAV